MYALPRNQRLVLSTNDHAVGSIADLARLAGNCGNDIGVIFVDQFDVERQGERWWQFDLLTGIAEPVKLEPGPRQSVVATTMSFVTARNLRDPYRRVPYGLEPSQAFITWRRVKRQLPVVRVQMSNGVAQVISGGDATTTDNVTIYIDRWIAEGDASNDDLDVARDAYLAHDFARAAEISKQVIPHSHELWLACIKLEFSLLHERTAAASAG